MKTVTCIGITVRDIIFSVETLPTGPGKIQALQRQEAGGGPAANAAATIAALGGGARFIGPVGDDRIGSELVAELGDVGVDVSRVRVVAGHRSPLSAVGVDAAGERSIVNHTERGLLDLATGVGDVDLAGSDAVLADVRWPRGAASALEWAREKRRPGVVDFDIGATSPELLLDRASHIVFSAAALRQVAGMDDLESCLRDLSRQTPAWLAVTDGAEGTLWLDDDQLREAGAFEVDVVDTTGAGDVYHGAFALALAEGRSEQEAVRIGSAAAALSCTRFGGRAGIPDRDELERLLQEKP